MEKITNLDLLKRMERLESRVVTMEASLRSEIGSYGSITMDLQRKQIEAEAVEKYKNTLVNKEYTKTWIEVGKQLTIILGIVAAILYAYAATKGIK